MTLEKLQFPLQSMSLLLGVPSAGVRAPQTTPPPRVVQSRVRTPPFTSPFGTATPRGRIQAWTGPPHWPLLSPISAG